MAKVRSFLLHETAGVPDNFIAAFITDCEQQHYVNVTTTYIPYPSPRLNIIVTKRDEKLPGGSEEQKAGVIFEGSTTNK